jgi:hypothetical protein
LGFPAQQRHPDEGGKGNAECGMRNSEFLGQRLGLCSGFGLFVLAFIFKYALLVPETFLNLYPMHIIPADTLPAFQSLIDFDPLLELTRRAEECLEVDYDHLQRLHKAPVYLHILLTLICSTT